MLQNSWVFKLFTSQLQIPIQVFQRKSLTSFGIIWDFYPYTILTSFLHQNYYVRFWFLVDLFNIWYQVNFSHAISLTKQFPETFPSVSMAIRLSYLNSENIISIFYQKKFLIWTDNCRLCFSAKTSEHISEAIQSGTRMQRSFKSILQVKRNNEGRIQRHIEKSSSSSKI